MADWRAQHPRATLTEIEVELDARLARMRARLLERVAQQSAATTWRQSASDQQEEHPDASEEARRAPQTLPARDEQPGQQWGGEPNGDVRPAIGDIHPVPSCVRCAVCEEPSQTKSAARHEYSR